MERMVVRGREDKEAGKGEEGAVVSEGLSKGAVEEREGAAEEAGVEIGELRLDEEGEDLPVPLAWVWVWIWVWATDWVWF